MDWSRCPFCKSEHCYYGSISIDGDAAMQECSCNKCGKEWTEIYMREVRSDADGNPIEEA